MWDSSPDQAKMSWRFSECPVPRARLCSEFCVTNHKASYSLTFFSTLPVNIFVFHIKRYLNRAGTYLYDLKQLCQMIYANYLVWLTIISWSLEAAKFGFRLFHSFWNLASTSTAALPSCLSIVREIRLSWQPTSRLRVFTRFGGKTSYCLANRGPGDLSDNYRTM